MPANFEPLRFFAELHGHLGWLAAAALIHPAILLRNPKRNASLAITLALGLITVTACSGAALYPDYRERVRQTIFEGTPLVGWMFERKEHLALAAALLAWTGGLARVASRRRKDPARATALARASHHAFVAAAAFAVVVATLGTWVASVKSF